MNVTQTIQSAVQVKSKGNQPEIDGEKFSKAIEQFTSASDLEKGSQLTEDSESEELGKQSSESNGETEKEAEPASFTLINPFLNLESEIKDIKTLGKSFNVHTEPSTSEATLIPVNQMTLSETKASLITVASAGISGMGAEEPAPNQLAEGKSLSEVGNQTTRAMESETINTPVNRDEMKRSEGLLNSKVSASAAQLDEQINEGVLTASSSTEKAKSDGSESGKTAQAFPLRNNDERNQLTVKESESSKSPTGKSETIKLSQEVIAAEKIQEKPVIEPRTLSESTTKKAETIEKTVSEAKGKEAISQSDTEYDFVSMLRQLSSQSAKTQAQTTVKPMPETNMPVPKEQGLNLVQEMVTSLVENKEGQKTYQTTLHLTPETLGKVTVELSFNEEGLSGKLTFQSDEARRWMEGEWLDLKLPLESKGLNIKSFDFTTSQPAAQQQSGFSFSEQSDSSGQDTERRSASGKDSSTHSENDEQNEGLNKNKSNGLNVYV
ncbi:Flagellar hook-length control protein FliK [Alkalibacterium putridalgicola]|uniref:Flagellar hook-length control protein FliK n=1 Tax=Alkalibacterium putridalgicola TaxID=426703 RepID=A0A1H7T6J2_9LACT|nr:flagellar hook-length control protein FliK [Alkalibacterium putridalgicola]GEK89354.1 hypothetical protein APU01nite_13930 [Alkalibacterium putridalgicola]SEL79866.1 Flagellar hook-length control protein FliK [Alkalibacterium putridalgicola]